MQCYHAINNIRIKLTTPSLYAHGNAANSTLSQVAGSIGTSIIITIMSKGSLTSTATNPLEAQVYGMNIAFASIGALTFIGLIIAFFVVKKKEVIVED